MKGTLSCSPSAPNHVSRHPLVVLRRSTACGAGLGCTPFLTVDASSLGSVCALVCLVSTSFMVYSKQRQGEKPVQTSKGDGWKRPAVKGPTACTICGGVGRIQCPTCAGIGRINYPEQLVLPKGVVPVHCLACEGTTLARCFKCLGTGETRPRIGFRV
ncbi:hypothetical protein Vretimale_541 [Volvox reticuliferus]|uniref:Uncharacterized protein n=1 Tax=Volvox reticuliferus TaxID=1737510 RepID=A0A8J4FDQ6_9CHLO|nr:hypothetical protein Vretifemale_2499 [Volvox reticuliferus]GIL94299.1 hypothetical protein Vretimale_541 [Volvox reticuliferus]